MKRGVPPTERKARTGELTPPGVVSWARANRVSLLEVGAVVMVVSEVGSDRGRERGRLEEFVGHQLAHAEALGVGQRAGRVALGGGDRGARRQALRQKGGDGG